MRSNPTILCQVSWGHKTLHSRVRGPHGVRYQSLRVQFNPVSFGPHRQRGRFMKSRSLGPGKTTSVFALPIPYPQLGRQRNGHHLRHNGPLNPHLGSFVQLSSRSVIKTPKKLSSATKSGRLHVPHLQTSAKKPLRQLSTLSA